VKIKTLYTYCEQVGRRGKDCEMKLMWKYPEICHLDLSGVFSLFYTRK
jgi:hypothetical protein